MATAALVVAMLALAAAVSGSALALPGKHSVKRDDIAKNAVAGGQVKDGSLTGADIDESSLARVPSASTADSAGDASSVDGVRIVKVSFRRPFGTPVATLFDGGGLVISAGCSAGGDVFVDAETLKADASIFSFADDDTSPADWVEFDREDGSFQPGGRVSLLAGDDGNVDVVEFGYSAPDRAAVQGTLYIDEDDTSCLVSGFILQG